MRFTCLAALFFVAIAAACGLDTLGTGPASVADDASDDGTTPGEDGSIVGDGGHGGDATKTDSGGARVTGAVVVYDFDEGAGGVVKDVSGVAPARDLTIQTPSDTRWISGGLAVDGPSLLFSAAAEKLVDACKVSNEVTLEAWVKPANSTQGAGSPARIVGLSVDVGSLDITLSAYGPDYLFRIRTSTSNESLNDISTEGGIAVALTHVVLTRSPNGVRRGFVNGQLLVESTLGGDLSTWSNYGIAVANEQTGTRPWLGELHLVAFYARALTAAEVNQNFVAGP